jgi:hypothetical protein
MFGCPAAAALTPSRPALHFPHVLFRFPQFFRDSDGSHAANIRLYDPNVIDAAATFGVPTKVRRALPRGPRFPGGGLILL